MSAGGPQSLKLNQWAFAVQQVFGGTVYQVGSSLDRKDWRDVDVVCMVDVETFKHWTGTDSFVGWNWRQDGLHLAFSAWGKEATGLPIDFKLQEIEWANKRHSGPRGYLGGITTLEEIEAAKEGIT